MPKSCSAYNCVNRCSGENKRLSYHRFPHGNPQLLTKWIEAMRRKDWTPSRTAVLCEQHFTENDYLCSEFEVRSDSYLRPKKRFLKKDAIPSQFNFSPQIIKGKGGHQTLRKCITGTRNEPLTVSLVNTLLKTEHSYAVPASEPWSYVHANNDKAVQQ